MNNKITCSQLWKKWEKEDPNNLRVIETRKRIDSYKKSDWEEMIADATSVIDKLKHLVVNNIDLNSIESIQSSKYLEEHINKYFFDVDVEYLLTMKYLLKVDQNYINFFNGFQDGLANRLIGMLDMRIKEMIV
jgi:Fe-S cluster biosynthesis and repair protein YggX